MPYYQKQSMNLIREAFDRLWNAQYQKIADLAIEAYITKEPLPYSQRLEGERHLFQPGDVWGELWDCGWFHFTGRVPDTACGANVAVMLDLSGEGLVVDQDGNPLLGITTRATSDFDVAKDSKRLVPVADCAQGGEVVDLWVDGGCNDLFGNYRGRGRILQAEIVICHPEFTKLYYDMEVLLNLAEHLPEDSARRAEILYGLNEAAGLLIRTDPDTLRKAGEIFDALLAKRGGDPSLKIIATGHSHIDLAWLWPIRETKRKGARTFSTVLANFEKYPDYYFGASQMQLYQWMKEGYPALYQRVKDKIAEGRWEVQGNMWVENDTNLTGGEAFVRQFLYGRRFAEKEFGKISRMCWLPDTFGYTGSLPQIMKKAGLEYFMTQKLSWDYHNDFPHHTFRWAGIDGTEVLAHMPPENTYNSAILPESVLFTEHNDKDKGVCPEAIMLFGIGDGGGGPGTEHLERISRMQNLSGLPPVEQGSIEAFFERIDQYRDRYKQWKGELYLSRHQGTYTTQARNKWYNRKMESALREAEYACSLAMQKGFPYPQEELEQIWKEVLLYQFHDIIPGSSIKRVYDESLARYELLLKHTRAIMQEAYAALSVSVGEDTPALVYNSLAFDRQAYIQLDGQEYKVKVPAFGYTAVSAENLQKDFHVRAEKNRISNGKLTLTFAEDGAVSSLYDEENRRECLRAPSNRFPVYYDNGNAWDIDIYYREKAPDLCRRFLRGDGTGIPAWSIGSATENPVAGRQQKSGI